jgi:hypothetical protein
MRPGRPDSSLKGAARLRADHGRQNTGVPDYDDNGT